MTPREQNEQINQKRAEHRRETEAALASYRMELDNLQRRHQDEMLEAAMFAGKLGLSYRPETNQVVFIVSSLENPADWDTKPWDPELVEGVDEDISEVDADASPDGDSSAAEADEPAEDFSDHRVEAESPSPAALIPTQDEPTDSPPATLSTAPAPATVVADAGSRTPRAEPVSPEARRSVRVLDVLAWAIPILPSVFVGFGLGTLAGLHLDPERPKWNLVMPILLGAAVIYGLKVLFHAMWSALGARIALGQTKHYWVAFASAVLLTIVFLGLEGMLGANALVRYSAQTEFSSANRMQLMVALPIALAVTSPILLAAAFLGFRHGREEVTSEQKMLALQEAEERQARELAERNRRAEEQELIRRRELEIQALEQESRDQQYRRELEAKQLEHEAELARREHELRLQWEEEDRARKRALQDEHRQELARKEADRLRRRDAERAELDSFRKHPDYVSLMQSLGRINVLRIEIERLRKEVTSFKISRGYDKMEVQ
jgi:hypothetical protein